MQNQTPMKTRNASLIVDPNTNPRSAVPSRMAFSMPSTLRGRWNMARYTKKPPNPTAQSVPVVAWTHVVHFRGFVSDRPNLPRL